MNKYFNKLKVILLRFRLLHLFRLLFNYKRYLGEIEKKTYFPECKQKSRIRVFCDQICSIIHYGNIEDYYFNYGHDRIGANISEYMLEPAHVKIISEANSHPFGYHVSWEKQFNYKALVRDKYLFALIVDGYGLPTPNTIGFLYNDIFFVQREKRIADINEILNYDMDVMLKPTTGNGGIGMHHIIVKDGIIVKNRKRLNIDELKSMLISNERYIIQEYVKEQHPAMASLFKGSLNTLRVTMVRDDDGNIHLLGVMCLMGAGDMIVSNWHYGGIIINVKNDGFLNEYGYSNSLKRTNCHPDTGVVFKSFRVPYYDETIEICSKAMRLFYGLKTLGWDIAITPDGPIFIEGNDMWGMPAHQMVEERGWKEVYKKFFNKKPN